LNPINEIFFAIAFQTCPTTVKNESKKIVMPEQPLLQIKEEPETFPGI
jgi:hypothetical protein